MNLNGPKNKKTNDPAYIPEMTLTDYMYLEKREEKELPASKRGAEICVNKKQQKQRGRRFSSIEDSVHASIQQLEDNIEKHERGLITAIRSDTDNTIDDRMTITRKQKWEGKQHYGRFKWLINTISHQKTWTWLRKGNLKRETISPNSSTGQHHKTNHIC